MEEQLIQRTRYLLRSRFRRAQTCPTEMFPQVCLQLMHWIENHPLLKSCLSLLDKVEGEFRERILQTLNDVPNVKGGYDPGEYIAHSSIEHAAVCYQIISGISKSTGLKKFNMQFLLCCLGEYLSGNGNIQIEEALTVLRDVAVDGLYEHLDENLDERNAIYAILIKYKQRSEWFRKERLRTIATKGLEKRTGEKALCLDVQEYVLNQGVDFFVEPVSPSGESDLVLKTADGRYVIIDAKYTKEDAARSKIVKTLSDGFHQVSRYCRDFNAHDGFLVNFIETSTRLNLEVDTCDGFPYLEIGGIAVYYIEIRISDEPSASKSGKASDIRITISELKNELGTGNKDESEIGPPQ